MKRSRAARLGLVLMMGSAALSACGDDDASGPTDMALDAGAPSFRADVFPIIAANCAISGCHGATRTSANLLMDTPENAHANLVGVAAMGTLCTEDSVARTRVVVGDAASSLLVSKVTEAEPDCGNAMPLGAPSLSASQQATITAWVAGGALDD